VAIWPQAAGRGELVRHAEIGGGGHGGGFGLADGGQAAVGGLLRRRATGEADYGEPEADERDGGKEEFFHGVGGGRVSWLFWTAFAPSSLSDLAQGGRQGGGGFPDACENGFWFIGGGTHLVMFRRATKVATG
jgi:hypothetical protein